MKSAYYHLHNLAMVSRSRISNLNYPMSNYMSMANPTKTNKCFLFQLGAYVGNSRRHYSCLALIHKGTNFYSSKITLIFVTRLELRTALEVHLSLSITKTNGRRGRVQSKPFVEQEELNKRAQNDRKW